MDKLRQEAKQKKKAKHREADTRSREAARAKNLEGLRQNRQQKGIGLKRQLRLGTWTVLRQNMQQ